MNIRNADELCTQDYDAFVIENEMWSQFNILEEGFLIVFDFYQMYTIFTRFYICY